MKPQQAIKKISRHNNIVRILNNKKEKETVNTLINFIKDIK